MKKNKEIKKNVESNVIKDINADTGEVKKFILILTGVALVTIILYFVSAKYVIKDNFQDNKEEDKTTETTISYLNVDVGNVFNRPYDEYYVFAYDTKSPEAGIYASVMNFFDSKKGKIYLLNLSTEVNKKYVGKEGNKKATKASELSLVEPTLIKIKKGKIDKYLENIDDIEKELKKKAE